MSAQNRAASDVSEGVSSPSETAAAEDSTSKKPDANVDGAEANSKALPSPSPDSPQDQHGKYSDGEGGSTSSQSSGEKDEYIIVKLADIRKEVQCPICLGIIRKTRTVMECLHRFCRECIDKSMRLGNNECPACRTHLASRRSLRDDPNYDALIAALYPDIDKYEEEELAFHEEEKIRNKKIQASIAETLRRQSEALGRRRPTAKATAAAFMRRSHGNYCTVQNSYFRCRGRPAAHNASPAVSNDDEEEDVSSNDAGKDSSSVEEASPDRRSKRRRMSAPKSSPARFNGNIDLGCDENYDLEMNRENFRTAPLRTGNRELAWGKGGVRSQSRHGNSSGSNGRLVKAARLTKLIEYLHNLDENEDKFDVHLTLLPLNEQSLPLESPYVCCPSGLSIRNIQQFIAIQTSVQYEGIDIFVRKPRSGTDKPSDQAEKVQLDPSEELLILGAEESLAGLLSSFTFSQGGLELLYRANVRKES